MEKDYVFRNPEMPSKTFVMLLKNFLVTLMFAQHVPYKHHIKPGKKIILYTHLTTRSGYDIF